MTNTQRLSDDQLRASLRAEGQHVPAIFWRGRLIDGRRRQLACSELGLDLASVTLPDEGGGRAVCAQLRDHFLPIQLAFIAMRAVVQQPGFDMANYRRGVVYPIAGRDAKAALGVHGNAMAVVAMMFKLGQSDMLDAAELGLISVDAAEQLCKLDLHSRGEALAKVVANTRYGGRRLSRASINCDRRGRHAPDNRIAAPSTAAARAAERVINAVRALEAVAGLGRVCSPAVLSDMRDAANTLRRVIKSQTQEE